MLPQGSFLRAQTPPELNISCPGGVTYSWIHQRLTCPIQGSVSCYTSTRSMCPGVGSHMPHRHDRALPRNLGRARKGLATVTHPYNTEASPPTDHSCGRTAGEDVGHTNCPLLSVYFASSFLVIQRMSYLNRFPWRRTGNCSDSQAGRARDMVLWQSAYLESSRPWV